MKIEGPWKLGMRPKSELKRWNEGRLDEKKRIKRSNERKQKRKVRESVEEGKRGKKLEGARFPKDAKQKNMRTGK